jgi:8-oxo-dGTP pyrophosphatase MutT (NUDIX family)
MERAIKTIYLGASRGKLNGKTPTLKSRGILHTPEGTMLLQDIEGNLILPGGKRDPGETGRCALRREVMEETGLTLPSDEDIEELFGISNYSEAYPHHNKGVIEQYTSTTYYAVLMADFAMRGVVDLTPNEASSGLRTIEMPVAEVCDMAREHQTDNPRWLFYQRELLTAMNAYLNMRGEI